MDRKKEKRDIAFRIALNSLVTLATLIMLSFLTEASPNKVGLEDNFNSGILDPEKWDKKIGKGASRIFFEDDKSGGKRIHLIGDHSVTRIITRDKWADTFYNLEFNLMLPEGEMQGYGACFQHVRKEGRYYWWLQFGRTGIIFCYTVYKGEWVNRWSPGGGFKSGSSYRLKIVNMPGSVRVTISGSDGETVYTSDGKYPEGIPHDGGGPGEVRFASNGAGGEPGLRGVILDNIRIIGDPEGSVKDEVVRKENALRKLEKEINKASFNGKEAVEAANLFREAFFLVASSRSEKDVKVLKFNSLRIQKLIDEIKNIKTKIILSAALPDKFIVFGNNNFKFFFDKNSGSLVSIFNERPQETYYFDEEVKQASPFRIFLQPDNHKIDPISFKLVDYKIDSGKKGETLTLISEKRDKGLRVEMSIKVPDDSISSSWTFKVTNTGTEELELSTWFPCFNNLLIGKEDDNLVTYPKSAGEVRKLTEQYHGPSAYGGGLGMQWICQFNRKLDQGLGIIVQDKKAESKVIDARKRPYLFIGYSTKVLAPKESYTYPETVITVHQGDWKKTAKLYREWFLSNFKIRKSPDWFMEESVGRANRSCENNSWRLKVLPFSISSFQDQYKFINEARRQGTSLVEQSGFSNSTALAHISNCGDYIPCRTLGGVEAYKEGLEELHRRGGRIHIYVEGLLTWTGSEVAKSGKSAEWSLMDKDGTLSAWYHQRYHECATCKGWQDYLVAKCKEIIEYGADAIRLDSLGCTGAHLCFNPKHAHYPDPNTWNHGMWEICKRVRKVMDEVNPDSALTTEGFFDVLCQHSNGSLASRREGVTEVLVRYTFPEIPLKMHTYSGAADPDELSIIYVNGYACALQHPKSEEYAIMFRNWNDARKLFKTALVYGPMLDDYPECPDPDVITRAYRGDRYYLVAGVRLGEKPGPIDLRIKGIKKDIKNALLLDIRTFEFAPISLSKDKGDYLLTHSKKFFMIFLPLKDCPPMVTMRGNRTVFPGDSAEVDFSLWGHWTKRRKAKAKVSCLGLKINQQETEAEMTIPCAIKIPVPLDVPSVGRYVLKVEPIDYEFIGLQRNIEIKAPVVGSVYLVETGDELFAKIYLKNNTAEDKKVSMSLVEPKNWGLPEKTIPLNSLEEKTLMVKPQIGAVGEMGDMFKVLIEYPFKGKRMKDYISYSLMTRNITFPLVGLEKTTIKDWFILGPFRNPKDNSVSSSKRMWGSGANFDKDFLIDQGGEANVIPKEEKGWKRYSCKGYTTDDVNKGKTSWKQYINDVNNMELDKMLGGEKNVILYAATYIDNPDDRDAEFWIRTGIGVKLWLNHKFIWQKAKTRDPSEIYFSNVKIHLKKGSNLLMMKLADIKGVYYEVPQGFFFSAGITYR